MNPNKKIDKRQARNQASQEQTQKTVLIIMDDIQKKIIREITEITFNFAGTSLAFKSEGFTKTCLFNRVVYHHTESSFFNSDGAHYNIKLRIIDEVIVDSRISRWKKCHYCRGRRCQTRLTCCGKPCHYMCAANHNFVCGCTQKKGSQGLINLCESIQEGNDENLCSVCMDEWTL